jgi:hypothetical protein
VSWFRLDDKFHSNPKVIDAGNAAIGLYVRCGTYCADHNTDGRIPAAVVRMYGNRKEIAQLLASNLWKKDGDEYVIPDYLSFNPSKEKVTADRAAAAERQRKARDAATAKRQASRVSHSEVTALSQRDSRVSHSAVTVPPTRPDPKTPLRAAPQPREATLVWDALTSAFGQATTKAEKTNRGRHVRELLEAGATADDVTARIREHKRRRLRWTLTANALVTHWTELEPKAASRDDRVWDPFTQTFLAPGAMR